jgi:hypothetical protein
MPITIRRKVAAPAPDVIVAREHVLVNLDAECLWVMGRSPNAAIPWFLMASYLYYHHDISLISDGLYDQMAKAILEAWDELEHMHKHLLTCDALRSGTMFMLTVEDYPGMTRGGARHLVTSKLGRPMPK